MGVKSFRELEVWGEAMSLVEDVYRLIDIFPSCERFALSDQIRRAVISVPSNIAEGFGRSSNAEFQHFLSISRGSLYELDTQLELAKRLCYISDDEAISQKMNSISKMLGSLIRSLATKHQVPSTKHQVPGTKHQAPSTHD